jgi:hypothetical protein
MSTPMMIIGGIVLLALLWLAYKIGKILIRIVLGLAALGLLIWLLWHFFAK